MEAMLAIAIGLLSSCGVYLMLRARTFPVILGLTLLSYAVNLFLFASGRLTINAFCDTSVHPQYELHKMAVPRQQLRRTPYFHKI